MIEVLEALETVEKVEAFEGLESLEHRRLDPLPVLRPPVEDDPARPGPARRQDSEVLLRVEGVEPERIALRQGLQIAEEPVVLEPLVDPGEDDAPGAAGLLDRPEEARVDRRLCPLVVPAMIEPLRLGVCDAPARRNPELRDEDGTAGVMADQLAQIARIGVGALRPRAPGIRDRGSGSPGSRDRRDTSVNRPAGKAGVEAMRSRVDAPAVVVVHDAFAPRRRASHPLEDRVLLCARGLGGCVSGSSVGQFVKASGQTRRTVPARCAAAVSRVEAIQHSMRVPDARRTYRPSKPCGLIRARGPIECTHRVRLPLPSEDDAEQPRRDVGIEDARA